MNHRPDGVTHWDIRTNGTPRTKGAEDLAEPPTGGCVRSDPYERNKLWNPKPPPPPPSNLAPPHPNRWGTRYELWNPPTLRRLSRHGCTIPRRKPNPQSPHWWRNSTTTGWTST